MKLSEKFFSLLPSNISHQTTKFFTVFSDPSDKKAYFSGKRVQLLEYDEAFGEGFMRITEEEARKKHVGKIRCLGIVSDEYRLLVAFSKYFKFDTPLAYALPQSIKVKKSRIVLKVHRLELKIDQQPSDRDEKDLIIAYRKTEDQKEKNRLFNVILFQRGVNGKTWHQIIKNYVSYNRHKFVNLLDRTEDDFYQDIVIAVQKQIAKWFDPNKHCCFSTYAWYVINCAFHRVLQQLSTQKRKVSSNNVDLDDQDSTWNETISAEKTLMPQQTSFENEFEQKNLCSQIMKMFELKEINAPDSLKQDLLKIIKEKSTMQNSLYTLAKKYNMESNEIFKIEMTLRENLKNAMYNDIILNMQYDINADEEIAKKYRRSKGHVIKMKRQLSTIVKKKLKGVEA
jgi:hypothetical protein